MAITSYRDLEVYKRSMRAMVTVHKLVQGFPGYERYGHCDQMRRASKSVPSNIAEGYGRRKSVKEFRHFLTNSLGSANEMIVHLEIARELGFAEAEVCSALIDEYTAIGKMLFRLIENWRTISPASSKEAAKEPTSHL